MFAPAFITGDCLSVLRRLPSGTFNTVVTSPPYFGLRDYGHPDQFGLETTPAAYVARLVEICRQIKRVLRDDGTFWLNLGDSYSGSGKGGNPENSPYKKQATNKGSLITPVTTSIEGLTSKQLIGIPWRVAFALQDDGWTLRQDIIWHKPNPMPESVTDRCTKAHEYIFMFSKSNRTRLWRARDTLEWRYSKPDMSEMIEAPDFDATWNGSTFDNGKTAEHQLNRSQPHETCKMVKRWRGFDYYFDGDAIKEPVSGKTVFRKSGPGPKYLLTGLNGEGDITSTLGSDKYASHRNRRSVWTVSTKPYNGAHFATFPPDLIEPCILAGSPRGGLVLDPFGGAGTTALVSQRLGRGSVSIELNPDYVAMAEARIAGQR